MIIFIILFLGLIFIGAGMYKDIKQWKNGYTEDLIHNFFYMIGIALVLISIICLIYNVITSLSR